MGYELWKVLSILFKGRKQQSLSLKQDIDIYAYIKPFDKIDGTCRY